MLSMLMTAIFSDVTMTVYCIKLTIKILMNKLNAYFADKYTDGVLFADIQALMNKCTNRESHELLKKAKERGLTHIIAKISGGKMTGEIEWIQDTSTTPDTKVRDLLGSEGIVIIER